MILKIGNKPYELATKEEVMKEVIKQMEATKKEIFDKLYPVGSVYISLDATFNPNNVYKGKWELIKEGLFLEATNQIGEVGKEIEAGIPNFEVKLQTRTFNNNTFGLGELEGAVKITDKTTHNVSIVVNTNWGVAAATISPSVTSKVYRDDCDTVQPHSIRAFMWQRIA